MTLGKLRLNLSERENFPICETVFDILLLAHILVCFVFPEQRESFTWRVNFIITVGVLVLSIIYTEPQFE